MKSYTRIARRRVEAAFQLRVDRTRPEHPAPEMDQPLGDLPVEVIDLKTGPFQARFPDLAKGNRET